MKRRLLITTTAAATFTAAHKDPLRGEGVHVHTWSVVASFRRRGFKDGRDLEALLSAAVRRWHGRQMPRHLWSTEAICARLLGRLRKEGCYRVQAKRADGCGAVAEWT